MTQISRAQGYQYAANAGFTGAALDEVVAIMFAESGGDTSHVNINKNGSTATVNGKSVQVPPGTGDYGPLQINTWWNPGVTIAQAQDPVFAFKWAYNVTGGRQPSASSDPFKPYWVTVQNGAYHQYLTVGGGSGTVAQGANATTNSGIAGALGGIVAGITGSSTAGTQAASNPALVAGINAGATSTALGTPSTAGDVAQTISDTVGNLTGQVPNLLVHIGLFLAALALVVAGFVLVANQEQEGTPTA
jgi:hypothetical protein